ncbi:MAG TPA: SMUG2 DNA glycosylase family protein [Edaphocola sp.]|nr:SMUG2 DNA glycosylase family protein [Edaphocola sp.]
MQTTFAKKIIDFNNNLSGTFKLPPEFEVLNPFKDLEETDWVMQQFYNKYYNDTQTRKLILGINPSRNGAGVTGIPFTDTKRLDAVCDIKMQSARTHETSSVFMYDMIAAYGGATKFYSKYFINSPFPLAIIRKNAHGKWINANYYDDARLLDALAPYMVRVLKTYINMGIDTNSVVALGLKNAKFIRELNNKYGLFKEISALEHPRFIQQYKSKEKDVYIAKYLNLLD